MQNTATPGNNSFEELKKIKFVLHSIVDHYNILIFRCFPEYCVMQS